MNRGKTGPLNQIRHIGAQVRIDDVCANDLLYVGQLILGNTDDLENTSLFGFDQKGHLVAHPCRHRDRDRGFINRFNHYRRLNIELHFHRRLGLLEKYLRRVGTLEGQLLEVQTLNTEYRLLVAHDGP